MTRKQPEASIIIPVHNKWELSRACLKALAATTRNENIEVIVVDNASTDATPSAAAFLGAQLFGDNFTLIRNEKNRNFGPASNQGALAARGDYLIFLNNDTETLPGWYRPLLDDFSAFSNIAGTGPLLLYPESGPFGHTVQHLGVLISPMKLPAHLYAGIPAASPLAGKRRFFQVITAACLVMPRKLFLDVGLFEEAYINGFEDVDLCARLSGAGFRFTVNPASRVVHRESQTPGRHLAEGGNKALLMERTGKFLQPDWHKLLQADGLILAPNRWLFYQIFMPQKARASLDRLAPSLSFEKIRDLLVEHPYWEKGWHEFTAKCPDHAMAQRLRQWSFKSFHDPAIAFAAIRTALNMEDKASLTHWLEQISAFSAPFEVFQNIARLGRSQSLASGLFEISKAMTEWQQNSSDFHKTLYHTFMKDYCSLAKQLGIPMVTDSSFYPAWREVCELPGRITAAPSESGPAFSILMPVYNPEPEHLLAAIDSVLAQNYSNWELCIADDASTDSRIRTILESCRQKDARIRVEYRQENGNISAASNTALDMARTPWSVLMDQDDIITEDALSIVAENISSHPEAALLYSDEDKMDGGGKLFQPYFKTCFDRELLLAQNFVSHLGVYRTDRLREIGGFRTGFEGAQDHDLLLRYVCGIPDERIIHIPHVLYHWRAHSGSTADTISAKSEAPERGRMAVQEYLDKNCPGAVATRARGMSWIRVDYPLPSFSPLASLVLDMDGDLAGLSGTLKALGENSGYDRHEIIVLLPESISTQTYAPLNMNICGKSNVRPVRHKDGASQAERLMAGIAEAKGEIIGFIRGPVISSSGNWLAEMVANASRPGVGVCGGKVINESGQIAHAGYEFGAEGILKPLYPATPAGVLKAFGLNRLPRNVAALDAQFLFTSTENMQELDGLDKSLPETSLQDYCLRLKKHGKRNVWRPFAEIIRRVKRNEWKDAHNKLQENEFAKRWTGQFAPWHESVDIEGEFLVYKIFDD